MKNDDNFAVGLIAGIAITILIWLVICFLAEADKIKTGFLTFQDKTYTVTLYDYLEIPLNKETDK